MEVRNFVDIHTREELYQWYMLYHDKADELWIRSNRAERPVEGVVGYIDAVEVALCFGWIDSVQKRIDAGKPIQRYTPRRKGCIWCEQNIERCRRLIKIGEMTPAGLAVLPDMDPAHFVFYDWVIDALKADPLAWENYQSFPDAYKRIKIFRIQHYSDTRRPDEAKKALRRFVEDTHNGKMQGGWSDYGRLIDY